MYSILAKNDRPHVSSVRSGTSSFKENISKDILDFSMFDITSCESPLPQQPLNQTLLEATMTHPNRPNIFV